MRLNDEDICTTDGVVIPAMDLTVGELANIGLAWDHTEVTSDGLCQRGVCSAGDDL